VERKINIGEIEKMTLFQELKNKSKEQLIKQIIDFQLTDKDREFIKILKKQDRVTLYELKIDHNFDSHSANRSIKRLRELGVIGLERYTDNGRSKVDYFLERLRK